MKIAIIGYGKMGKEIEKIAQNRNHEIVMTIDINDVLDIELLSKCDVAIEFTNPKSAFNNYLKCFEVNIPVVSGTTGWLDKLDYVKYECLNNNKTFFYASNFSLGVNLFFKLNNYLAKIMNHYSNYSVDITEVHHTQKLDAPSGTAISLADDIIKNIDSLSKWEENINQNKNSIPIKSIREGDVKGTHIIKYESDIDFIEIKHFAKNRKGFALGAVVAAEYAAKNQGFLQMTDLIGSIN